MGEWQSADECPKCGGSGWFWWKEFDECEGPGLSGGFYASRYTCDHPTLLDKAKAANKPKPRKPRISKRGKHNAALLFSRGLVVPK